MLHDPNIYSLFQHGLIKDDFWQPHWQAFKAKNTPYFAFDSKPFGAVTERLVADKRVFTRDTPAARDPFAADEQEPF